MRFIILGIALISITHSCVARVSSTAAVESDIVCPIEQSDDSFVVQYPSRISCNIFYKCNRGVAIRVECSDGLHYNERIQACDYPGRANCQLNSKPESGSNAEVQEIVQEARSFFGPKTEVIESNILDSQALQKILESVLLELKIILGFTPRYSEEEQQQYTNDIQNYFVPPQLTEFLQLSQEEPLTAHAKSPLEDKGNALTADSHPKLPSSKNDTKQQQENVAQHKLEIAKEKEPPLPPKLPQSNITPIEPVLNDGPKLPADNNKPKEPEEKKDIIKLPEEKTEFEGKQKIKTPQSAEPDEQSKQLRLTVKQPLNKPNKQPSAAVEEDTGRKEEIKDESDKKDVSDKKEENEKNDDDKQKAEKAENEKENTKNFVVETKGISAESDESVEDEQDGNGVVVEEIQPKPIRRTKFDSEQNSDEITSPSSSSSSNDIVKEKPKVPNPTNNTKGKENNKKPADKTNESKKPISIQ